MRARILLAISLFLAVFADPVTRADNVGPSRARKPISRFGDGAKADGMVDIKGHCEVQSSETNPIATPCSSVVLRLTDKGDKTTVIENRTDKNGDFAFSAVKGHLYVLTSGSRFYGIAAPARPVKAGETIAVKLSQQPGD